LPVIPCHLTGGVDAWPKGKAFPRPRRLRLRLGTPLTYAHLDKTTESVKAICGDLEKRVNKLGSTRP